MYVYNLTLVTEADVVLYPPWMGVGWEHIHQQLRGERGGGGGGRVGVGGGLI